MKTLVYKYGLLPPTENKDIVDEQIPLGWAYYNKLIEIDIYYRKLYREERCRYCPEIEMLESWDACADDDLEERRLDIRRQRSKTRSRSETPEQRQAVKDAIAYKKEVYALLKAGRKKEKGNKTLQLISAKQKEERKLVEKKARAECGCYWGTYLAAEQAVDLARASKTDPEVKKKRRRGTVAVQLQNGMEVASLFDCEDRRLRIYLKDGDLGKLERREIKRCRGKLAMRVGTKDRKPIWAEWPIVFHRPLPEQAKIMWAKVIREKIERHYRWFLCLTVNVPSDWRREECGAGAVAVNLGWRQKDNGLRVIYYRTEEGENNELLIDPTILSGLQQVDDLKSIRDQRKNALKETLGKWFVEHAAELPDWLKEDLKFYDKWKGICRFVRLYRKWKSNRWAGDSAFLLLEAWHKKDDHLWLWQENLRDKVLMRRREQYRVFAAKLARRFRTLLFSDFNLKETQKHENTESVKVELEEARLNQVRASPHELRDALKHAFTSRGGEWLELSSINETAECSNCGSIEDWDRIADIEHRCEECGELWDQDDNATRNLLNRYREKLSGNGKGGDEKEKKSSDYENREARWAKRGRHRSKKNTEMPENTGIV
jgi:hypothetical protein